MTLQAFGERVRIARHSAGLSQAELADIVGLSRPAISGIEAGKNGVPLCKLQALCDALETDPNTLLGY